MAEITQEDRNREQIMNTLAQLGSLTVQDDGLIFDGTRIILPKQMEGNILQVVRFLMKWQEGQRPRGAKMIARSDGILPASVTWLRRSSTCPGCT